ARDSRRGSCEGGEVRTRLPGNSPGGVSGGDFPRPSAGGSFFLRNTPPGAANPAPDATLFRREPPAHSRDRARVRGERDRPGGGGARPYGGVSVGERGQDGRAGAPGHSLAGGARGGGDGPDQLHHRDP